MKPQGVLNKSIIKSFGIPVLFHCIITSSLLSLSNCWSFSAECSGSRLSLRMPPCPSTLVHFCWSKQFWRPCFLLQRGRWGVSCSVYKRCGQTTLQTFPSFCFCVRAAATLRDFGSLCLHKLVRQLHLCFLCVCSLCASIKTTVCDTIYSPNLSIF